MLENSFSNSMGNIKQGFPLDKRKLAALIIINLAIPLTVILAISKNNFLSLAVGPEISSVAVDPGEVNSEVGGSSQPLSALAYDSAGNPVFSGVTYEWSMSSTNSVGTLTQTQGDLSEFLPLTAGCGEITAIARSDTQTVTKSASVAVSDGANVPNCSGATPTPTPTPGPIVGAIETTPVVSATDAADDLLIWIHPTDPSQSLVMGNDKKGGYEVYRVSTGERVQLLPYDTANTDIRYNFPLGGESVAIVAGFSSTKPGLIVLRVDPVTGLLSDVTAPNAKVKSGGGGMYHSQVTGKYYWFTSNNATIYQYELKDNGAGLVTSTLVRTVAFPKAASEGLVADDILGQVYFSIEKSGLYKMPAEPSGGNSRTLVDTPISVGGHFQPDLEGLTIYYKSDGTGYLFASSQGNNSYNIFRREGANEFIGNFQIVNGASIDGTSKTDGIDVTNFPLDSNFPAGLFVAQDGANFEGAVKVNQNFKLVDFRLIANKFGLSLDTSWDPRLVGSN